MKTPARSALTAALLLMGGCDFLNGLFGSPAAAPAARGALDASDALIALLESDTRCGFAAPAVRSAVEVVGAPGDAGAARWRVENCRFDLGTDTIVQVPGCDGEGGVLGSGTVVVSAERIMSGRVTGDLLAPIVPGGPDALVIDVRATATDLRFARASRADTVTVAAGTLSFRARPRLAESRSTPGVCAARTPNTLFTDVNLADATVGVTGAEGEEITLKVMSTTLRAVRGVHLDGENVVTGTVVLEDDQTVDIQSALDPTYNRDAFIATYVADACATSDVRAPLSFVCEGDPLALGPEVGRISAQALHIVSRAILEDIKCGFAAPEVLDAVALVPQTEGLGSARWTVSSCELRFPTGSVVDRTCTGAADLVSGRIVVSGTRTLRGRLTGDASRPVLPRSDGAESVALEIQLDGFRVEPARSVTSARFESGTLAGVIEPRLVVGNSTGACSVRAVTARIDEARLTNASLVLRAEGGATRVDIEQADVVGQLGPWLGQGSTLSGTVRIDGEVATIPSGTPLLPAFSDAGFDASWTCRDELAMPLSDACDLDSVLFSETARRSAHAFAALVAWADGNGDCGFAEPDIAVTLGGSVGGDDGSATTSVAGCVLTQEDPLVVEDDCIGDVSSVVGTVEVTGQKVRRGFRTGDVTDPIVPVTSLSTKHDLTLNLTGVRVETKAGAIEFAGGTMSGSMERRDVLDTSSLRCDIPTPAVTLTGISMSGVEARVFLGGIWVRVPVSSASFDGTRDTVGAAANILTGTLQLDVTAPALSVPVDGTDFEPEWSAESLATSVACRANVEVPDDESACSYNRVLADAAARLLVRATADAAKRVNNDSTCGFAAAGVLANPLEKTPVNAGPGDNGTLVYTLFSPCPLGTPSTPTVFSEELCDGRELHRGGRVTVQGNRSVAGQLTLEDGGTFTFDGVIARSALASTLALSTITFAGTEVFETAPGSSMPPAERLVLRSGSVSAQIAPVLGASASLQPTAYPVFTPVMRLPQINVTTTLDLELSLSGRTFRVPVTAAVLNAARGRYLGDGNRIAGSMTVRGEEVVLAERPLEAGYDQTLFDDAYECLPDLAAPILPN